MSKNNLYASSLGIRVSTFILPSAIIILLLSTISCPFIGKYDPAVPTVNDPAVPTVSVSPSATSMTYNADPLATIKLTASLANGVASTDYEWTVEPETAGTVESTSLKKDTATFTLKNAGSGTVVISASTTSGEKPYTGSTTITLNKAEYGDIKPVVYATTSVGIALRTGSFASIDIDTDNRAKTDEKANNIFFPKDPSLTIVRTVGSDAMEAVVDNASGTITFTNKTDVLADDTYTFTLTYTDDNYKPYTLEFTVTPDESKGTLQITASNEVMTNGMTYGEYPSTLIAAVEDGVTATTYTWSIIPQTAGTITPQTDTREAIFSLSNVGTGSVTISATMTANLKEYSGSVTITLNKAAYGDTMPVVYDTTATSIGVEAGESASIAISKDNRGDFFPKTTSLSIARKDGASMETSPIAAAVDNDTGKITFTNVVGIAPDEKHIFTLSYTDENYEDYPLDFSVVGITITINLTPSANSMTYGDAAITLTDSIEGASTVTSYEWEVEPASAGTISYSDTTDKSRARFTLENVGDGSVTISTRATTEGGNQYTADASITLNKAAYGDTMPVVYDTTATSIGVEAGESASIAISKDNRGDFFPKTTSLSIARKDGASMETSPIAASVDNDTGMITFTVADVTGISSGVAQIFILTYIDNNYEDLSIEFTVTPEGDISGYSLSYKAKGSIGIALDAGPIWDTTPTATYEIAPELPTELGVTFNTDTGKITGTPKTGGGGLYTVTATAASPYIGTKEVKAFITVFIDPVVVSEPTDSIAIETQADLGKIGRDESFPLSGTYHLTADIDLDDPASDAADLWEPIGSESAPFTGSFQGNGHIIYNLTIAGLGTDADLGNYQGLFAAVGSTAKVENLGIGISSIKGNAAIGTVAGRVVGGSATNIAAIAMSAPSADAQTLEASGTVAISGSTGSYVGGLVGWSSGTVSGYATGAVTSASGRNVGGLVGANSGTVSGYATGAVAGSGDNVGGLVGANFGTVSGYATGDVTSTVWQNVGGLVGYSNGTVSGYATGAVTGENYVGGLLGANFGTVSGYATSAVTGANNVGGLMGYSNGTVSGYATGAVTGTGSSVGGLVGLVTSGTVSGYATGAVTGANSVGGLVGHSEGTMSGYATGDVTSTGGQNVGGLVGWSNGTVSGYATGVVTGSGDNVGGLVGVNNGGTVSGYATGDVTSTGGQNVGGLVGYSNGTVSGYWDKASTKQANGVGTGTLSGGEGISATKNIALDSTTYTDSGATDPSAAIFNDATFITVFELPGAAKTWPKLKASYTFNSKSVSFDWSEVEIEWKQPTVSDTDGDGKIEVVVN